MRWHGVQRRGILTVVAGAVVALVLAGTPGQSGADEFADLRMFIEYNSSDNDAGIQVFLDGDGWEELEIRRNGRVILEIEAELGPFKRTGLTEIRWETAEPSPELIFARFPEGLYRFRARKVGGGTHVGTVELSHSLPPAPCNLAVSSETLSWAVLGCPPAAIPGDETVASFEVIVENETVDTKMETTVPVATLQIQVPPHVLGNPATDVVNVEVLAVGENGNKTITEVKNIFGIP
jgi:hypothetical protein